MIRRRPQASARSCRALTKRPALETLESRRLLTYAFPDSENYLTSYQSSTGRAWGSVLADFNHDDRLDMAYANPDLGAVVVRMGQGDGQFSEFEDDNNFGEQRLVQTGGAPVDLQAVDLNLDARVDLVVADWANDQVVVYYGQNDGTFRDPSSVPVGRHPRRIIAANLDGDHFIDFVVAHDSQEIGILSNHGSGPLTLGKLVPVGDSCLGIAVGDVDQDGLADIVGAGDSSVCFLHNDPEYGIRFVTARSATQGRQGRSVAVADFNGDGRLDAAVAATGSNFVSVLAGDGTGRFGVPTLYTLDGSSSRDAGPDELFPWSVDARDMDGDRKPDLVIGSSRGIQVRLGVGDGRFSGPIESLDRPSAWYQAFGDVDHDGRLDALVADNRNGLVWVLRNSIGDPPPQGVLGLNIGTGYPEGDSGEQLVSMLVTIGHRTTETVTVKFATGGGTAIPGVDYTPVQGTLTFLPGQQFATFDVPFRGDRRVDGNRTIGLQLSSPTGPAVLSRYGTYAEVEVLDDEVPSTFQFRESVVSVDPSAGFATVTVVRDDDRSDGVMVSFATAGGTAVAGTDYAATSGTLRFAPGQKSQSVQIPLLDHAWWAEGKTVTLRLSDPQGGRVGAIGASTVTIQVPAPVVVRSATPTAGADRKLSEVTLTFSGPLDPRSARTLSQYKLVTAGRDGVLGTRDDRTVGLRVAYQAGTRQVTLSVPASGRQAGPYRLTVGPKLLDARRRAVDGDANGQAGGTFATVLRT